MSGPELFESPIVLLEQDPAIIRGGRSVCIQHMIAAGHWNIFTPSGGPHLSLFQ